ncbi:MAG: hypothetical protein VR78_01450 [Hoeflea sp. BRH_c9]|nr:MAG: hypothetical protein VR78_01450 [Hoeflea sp. BRH_c9]
MASDWPTLPLRTGLVAAIWTGNSLAYYGLSSALGLTNGYQQRPILFAALNGAFALGVALVFRGSRARWERVAPKAEAWPKVLVFAGALAFVFLGLPALPAINWQTDAVMPTLMAATAPYFLPKTLEIWFQQILIVTLIMGFWQHGLPLRKMAILLGAMFGGFHLTLVLNGNDPFYIARYTVAATLMASVMPWLILRVRSGYTWAFGIHWAFYAVDKTLSHFAG